MRLCTDAVGKASVKLVACGTLSSWCRRNGEGTENCGVVVLINIAQVCFIFHLFYLWSFALLATASLISVLLNELSLLLYQMCFVLCGRNKSVWYWEVLGLSFPMDVLCQKNVDVSRLWEADHTKGQCGCCWAGVCLLEGNSLSLVQISTLSSKSRW